MGSPFQHTETSYDILHFLEHNDRTIEHDDYWTFMGLPLYDSSRPSSVVSRLFNDVYLEKEVNKVFLPSTEEPKSNMD